MTTKELANKLSARMFRTINGFYCDGAFYNGYLVIDENTIEFTCKKADAFYRKLVDINRVSSIDTIWAFNEREGRKLPYSNVILKA